MNFPIFTEHYSRFYNTRRITMLPDDLKSYRAPHEPGWPSLIASGICIGIAAYLITVLFLTL